MNKKFLVSILIVATIFTCICLTRCNKAKTNTVNTKQEQVKKQVNKEELPEKINESKNFETKEEIICYRILDEKNDKKVYYNMDMPQAIEVTNFLFNYVKVGDNINYKTVKGDKQYEYYSKKLQKEYGGKKQCDEDTIESQKNSEIIQSFLGFKNYNFIEFNKDFTTCKISVNRLIKFDHLSPTSRL